MVAALLRAGFRDQVSGLGEGLFPVAGGKVDGTVDEYSHGAILGSSGCYREGQEQ